MLDRFEVLQIETISVLVDLWKTLTANQQDEPIGGIRHVRRIPHPGRGMGGTTRARRTNMHFQSAGSALSGLSPSSRETTMDPIAGKPHDHTLPQVWVLGSRQTAGDLVGQ